MHPRYPAPYANVVFDDRAKFERWRRVTVTYAQARINDDDSLSDIEQAVFGARLLTATAPSPAEVADREQTHGHDVVAFLDAYTSRLPDRLKPYIHYGLTSSDIVDTAHFMSLATHADHMVTMIHDLVRVFDRWFPMRIVRAGRTHGQLADVTGFGHQLRVHADVLTRIANSMSRWADTTLLKSPGPTGCSPLALDVAADIAHSHRWHLVPSTQVIPRDWQVEWASLYLRLACELESLATLIRCGARQEIGELREGSPRVGSSSMPTKKNPIDSEKVCGLARVARGYFATIAENVALWDDRDISNSSVERIVVPDFAAVVESMAHTMTKVMLNLEVDYARMAVNAESLYTATNLLQTLAQKHFGLGPVEAGVLMRKVLRPDNDYIDTLAVRDAGYDNEQIENWLHEYEEVRRGVLGSDKT